MQEVCRFRMYSLQAGLPFCPACFHYLTKRLSQTQLLQRKPWSVCCGVGRERTHTPAVLTTEPPLCTTSFWRRQSSPKTFWCLLTPQWLSVQTNCARKKCWNMTFLFLNDWIWSIHEPVSVCWSANTHVMSSRCQSLCGFVPHVCAITCVLSHCVRWKCQPGDCDAIRGDRWVVSSVCAPEWTPVSYPLVSFLLCLFGSGKREVYWGCVSFLLPVCRL